MSLITDRIKVYVLLALSAVLSIALVTQHFKYSTLEVAFSNYKAEKQVQLVDLANKTAKTYQAVLASDAERRRRDEAREAESYAQLQGFKNETAALNARIKSGDARLRILGATCKPAGGSGVSSTSEPARVVDGTVEYSADLQQDILRLRDEVYTDQVKIRELQAYIVELQSSHAKLQDFKLP